MSNSLLHQFKTKKKPHVYTEVTRCARTIRLDKNAKFVCLNKIHALYVTNRLTLEEGNGYIWTPAKFRRDLFDFSRSTMKSCQTFFLPCGGFLLFVILCGSTFAFPKEQFYRQLARTTERRASSGYSTDYAYAHVRGGCSQTCRVNWNF